MPPSRRRRSGRARRSRSVYLAQTGAHLEGFYNEAAVNVNAADNCVSALDIDTVCRLAMAKELPEGRAVVHHIRRPFRLDGRLVPDPEHLVGHRLEVGYWTVHGSEAKIGDHIHVITGFNLRVEELILSSLASGTMVTSAEERQNGVLVLDIGCGTTDFVLYRDGVAYQTGVVPVGGDHFTNDLSLGPAPHPRRRPRRSSCATARPCCASRDKHEKVWLNGDYSVGDRQFPRQSIEQITAARARELLEVVRKKLGAGLRARADAGGRRPHRRRRQAARHGRGRGQGLRRARAGSASRLPGWPTSCATPASARSLGLLYYGLNSQAERTSAARRSGGFLQSLKRILIPA